MEDDGESLEETGENVNKLNFESVPEAKDSILKTARRIKPEGIHIFEDLAEETMERRIAQLLVLCCCVYPCKV